jgi:galactokinase
MKEEETAQTSSLIRGIANKFIIDGYKIGGFNCVIESQVAIGSGLSSSASIEVLIGTIFNNFYNNDKINPIEIAKIGQYAENNYFGKPCGLMDQLAIACGGIVGIDFADFEKPVVENIKVDFTHHGYAFVIIETGGSHADLADDYSSIPAEMKAVANYFNKKTLRSVKREQIIVNITELRNKYGDRAILRAFHFLEEDKRAASLLQIIKDGDINLFLNTINEAGSSSVKWLQNAFSTSDVRHQGINLALELTENFRKNKKIRGASKVHGGGFAGTILSIIENSFVDEYINLMKKVFGENAVTQVYVRDIGATFLSL